VETRREKRGSGRKKRKEGAESATRRGEHMWNGCGEMRKRERKEQREILKRDGMDEKDMKQEGQNRRRKRWGIERKNFFWNCYFYV
jgi:hypothetical protein